MNPHSGHLVDDIFVIPELERAQYKMLPQRLQADAEAALAGAHSTMVSMTKPSKLARWAKGVRKAQKRAKRQMVNASRRKNRG